MYEKLYLQLDEFCKGLRLIIQEKNIGNDSTRLEEKIVGIMDKVLEWKCITSTWEKNIFFSILIIYK